MSAIHAVPTLVSIWKEGTSVFVDMVIVVLSARHYENMPIQIYWKFYNQKTENFQIKNSDIFHIPAQNIDCGYSLEPPRRGGSNEYPQSIFFSKIRKIIYTPVNPSFTIWKRGLRGSKLHRRVFVMDTTWLLPAELMSEWCPVFKRKSQVHMRMSIWVPWSLLRI